jgi:hypothetical protein
MAETQQLQALSEPESAHAGPGSKAKGSDGLTDRQRTFVQAFVANGGCIARAALTAGYAKGNAGRVTASKTLRLPHVQRAMMAEVAGTLGVATVSALTKLIRLSDAAKSEYVQLEASRDILDRAGMRAADRSITAHRVVLDIDLG